MLMQLAVIVPGVLAVSGLQSGSFLKHILPFAVMERDFSGEPASENG